ncbi:MAG: 2-C-methyl-D-erythritol 2,4-cyclodiphosphate synthase [Caldisericaceae bacterium]
METRVGLGYDSHRFEKGRKLFLGGVEIPSEYGLQSNTDGDILIHALIDALLGAIAFKDIGRLFPEESDDFKNKRSTELLKIVVKTLKERMVDIVNIDAVVILEKPKIAPFVEAIKENLSHILEIDKERINLKGKTNEKMGFVGEGVGAVALVTVLVKVP